MNSIIMLSATILLLFVVTRDTEANISLGSCSLSCNENEDQAHGLIGTRGELQGAPGKRGLAGRKGDGGVKGDVGVKGVSGTPGIPGESCDCSRYDELATQMVALQAKVNKMEERGRFAGDGWTKASNNHYYKYFNHEKVNYETAKSRCESFGARLASTGLRNSGQRTEVKQLLPNPIPNTWIGLDNLQSVGNYVWSDGVLSTRSNTNWASSVSHSQQRCASIENGLWNFACSHRFYYFCEF